MIFHFVLLVTERASEKSCTPVAGRELDVRQKEKLTLPDIKSLDPSTKSIYRVSIMYIILL